MNVKVYNMCTCATDLQGDNISLSSSAMDTIMDYIDVNKDGEIDLRYYSTEILHS